MYPVMILDFLRAHTSRSTHGVLLHGYQRPEKGDKKRVSNLTTQPTNKSFWHSPRKGNIDFI